MNKTSSPDMIYESVKVSLSFALMVEFRNFSKRALENKKEQELFT